MMRRPFEIDPKIKNTKTIELIKTLSTFKILFNAILFKNKFNKPGDNDLLNYDGDRVDNRVKRCNLEYFSSYHYMTVSQMVPVLFVVVFLVYDIWRDDFETKPKIIQKKKKKII